MPVMYMHRMDDPDYNIGGVEDMGEDDHGWWIKARLDMDNPIAKQVYKLVKAGRLSQLSFAFDVQDAGPVTLDNGVKARELRRVKVYEASIVPVGANQDTSFVAIKSEKLPTPKDVAKVEKPVAKAGATLSQATSAFIQNVYSQLSNLAQQVQTFLAQNKSGDVKKNVDHKPDSKDKTEEPSKAKAEDPKVKALDLATKIAVRLDGGKD